MSRPFNEDEFKKKMEEVRKAVSTSWEELVGSIQPVLNVIRELQAPEQPDECTSHDLFYVRAGQGGPWDYGLFQDDQYGAPTRCGLFLSRAMADRVVNLLNEPATMEEENQRLRTENDKMRRALLERGVIVGP